MVVWLPGAAWMLVICLCVFAIGVSLGYWQGSVPFPDETPGSRFVRIEPIRIPVTDDAGQTVATTSLVFVLEVPDLESVQRARALEPRLRDRLVSELGQRVAAGQRVTITANGLKVIRQTATDIAREVIGADHVSQALIADVMALGCPILTRYRDEPPKAAPNW
ncbi:MAG: hypothetical protein GC191_10185 [Azospirillum sp.]|nr:hypothetical protein [Azospirillum sp.]